MNNKNVTLDEAALTLRHTVGFYTGDSEKWAKFLKQSAFLYKYDIINKFLIANYGYGKNVTAAASESEWKRLKASVNENAEGIPVLRKNNEGKQEISYVYDITDTNSDYKIWQPDITSDNTLKAVANYFKARGKDFKAVVDNSIMDIAGENLSPTEKEWNDFILNSIKYIVYTRCGLNTSEIDIENLSQIELFNSVDTAEGLNFTLNNLNKMVFKPAENILRGIERSVIAVDRQKNLKAERENTVKHENNRIVGQTKNRGRFFTSEEIQAAKAVSLVDYLGYRGENLKRVGNKEYTMLEHDSMRISDNKYYWNSRSRGGTAVDFCMNYYNMTFQEAVKSLLDYSGNAAREQPRTEKQTKENTKAQDPAKPIPFALSEKTGRVFKYLTESRGLSADMVNSLINEGKIAQDIHGNVVFKVFDRNGKLNGSELNGTSQNRYKLTTGLEGNGFTVNPTGTYNPEKAVFFESAIDLLSYYELHKDETALLISMGGLKDKTVLKAMEDYNLSTENCLVAVDNDEAGEKFINKMKTEYNINAYSITEDERFILHENVKDWNDLLKAEKEDKTEHLTAYHITDVDFDTFRPGYRGVIWTEKNLDFAKSRMAYMGSDRIFTCDVTMKKPKHITIDSGENWDIDREIRKARNEGCDGIVMDFKLADEVRNNSLFQYVLTHNLKADARDILYSIIKANASDALENETLSDFVKRVEANNFITHSYVAVFKPEQVKITDKTLLNELPEIGSAEQENETDLKNAFEKALQNHEPFYIKYTDTEENFENFRIAYDENEGHYNIIADNIFPVAKIRENDFVEKELSPDIDTDTVIEIIKSYDNEISPDNLKTAEQVQKEKQLAAQAEQTVINNYMKKHINSNDVFCPNLDLGELYSITNEFFYYENSSHSADEKIKELAERYRNGENISTELGKLLDCETHIKIDADEERYDAGLPNDKDLFADIAVEKDENGITFSFGDIKRFCTWEEYGKGQFEYLKGFFRSSIYTQYYDDNILRPEARSAFKAFYEIDKEDDDEPESEPERTMPEEKLNRLLARLDGKELTAVPVGEFYELYGKDAQAAAEVLGFKLSHKNINGVSVPMVGFPRFSLEHFRSQLADEGYFLNINKADENNKSIFENTVQGTEETKSSFSVYQLKDGDETRYHRYVSYDDLQKSGLSVNSENYNSVYNAPLEADTSLEDIFVMLNARLPEGFKGRSLSVSDVVVINKDGQDKAYYVDSVGFKEVPEFLQQKEAAKNDVQAEQNKTDEKPDPSISAEKTSAEPTKQAQQEQKPERKKDIIGNTPYRYIAKKRYRKFDNDTAEKIAAAFEEVKLKYSGVVGDSTTTLTFSGNDLEKAEALINSVTNKNLEAKQNTGSNKETESSKINQPPQKLETEKSDIEAAPTITQDDINSVLNKGSGFQSGKYRIYRQFRKQEKSKVNADFLRDEYGIGGGTHIFPDDVRGWSDHNAKGITIRKYGTFEKPDVKLNWSQVEKQIKKLISEDKYFTDKDNEKYPEYLKSINAPQYEIDNFIKSVHQKFILSKSKLPPNEKRDTLALRLSDFIRDLDGYEKNLLKKVDRTDLADVTADEMEKYLGEPETVQQLMDFLKDVQWETSDAYDRRNSWYFRQELTELFPTEYVFNVGSIAYINSEQYEVIEAENNRFLLQNVDMPLDRNYYSNEELQEILKESPKNNDLRAVKIPKQVEEAVIEEKQTEKFSESSAQNEQYKPKAPEKVPVYKNTGEYAAENGERDLLRASNKENQRCREAIEKAISENFDGMHLDKKAVDGVVEQFGAERVSYVLAATIKAKDYDKRFSNSNRKWADTIDASFRSSNSFSEIINRHPAILDGFVKQFRESIEREKIIEPKQPPSETNETVENALETQAVENTDVSSNVQGKKITAAKAENFHITDYDLGVGSPKEKYRRNIEAIKTLFKIENENRQATAEEQEILSKYVGWGGLPEVFDVSKSPWHNEYEEVKSLLSESEYRAAKSSTLNAHYTTPLVISSIYKVLESAGFKGGKILEPAMGVGNFFGLLPESMKNSELYGVELDSITGRIAKQLYPNADIQVKGFEKTDFDSGFFDAAVGNVPFGNYRLYDEEFHNGELIHDFFFKKSLDKVRPGGLVAFVTSKGTLDKADTKVREYLAQRADLLGAIRLPNTAFKKNANTEVTADILFLKKRENLRDFDKEGKPEWVETTTTLNGLTINSYFASHPQMILGEMAEVTRRYGKETACLPFENKSLDELLEEAVSELGKDIAAMDKKDLKNEVTADTVKNDIIPEENIKLKEIVIELNRPAEIEKEPIIEETETIVENGEPVTEEAEPVIEDVKETKPAAEPPKRYIYHLNYRNFCYCNIDGDIYYRENKNMEKQDFSKKHIKNAEDRVKGMIEISGCLQELIRFQKENYDDKYIIKQQNKLNELYNNFTEKYGLLSDRANRSLFLNDDTYPLLQSLENINSKGELESKADIFTKRTIVPYVEIDSVDTAAEALAVSISEKAGADIDFMAKLCSKTNEEVIKDLEGVIFKNPVTEKYETSDEYLSGNVREKLKTAEAAAKKDSSYNINVSYLKEAQPKDLTPEEISVQLGSTWVPVKYYEQFMYELLDTPSRCQSDKINAYSGDPFKSVGSGANSYIIAIDYNNFSATYAVSNKENYKADKENFKAVETYGTSRINAYKIIEDTLNMKTVKIVDYIEDANGKIKAVPNEKETILAQEKQALIKSKFREWIFDDAERTADLCKIYNEKFNSVRPREYSGKHINFVGMNPEITLKEHQKNAIAHTLYGGNTLLAHSVGSGKTYEMVASAMESKRLGLCTKSLIVVPKHIVNQTAKEFLQLYPAANILVPNEKDFTAKNRQKFCSRISTGNYDAIIISHNQFEKIPLSVDRQITFIEEEIDEITKNLEMLKNQRGERGYTVKDLERTRKNLENTLETLNNNKKRDTVVTFEELGVDKLYVDEV
ncbi:MAG: DUF3849 domain-containing protein, partial [Clostridiales bacterium]|nr:DUF3849 domain-containing protein [Clostridiales bacterium]